MSDWMNRNKFKINQDKTKFLIAGTSRQHAKVLFDSLSVSGTIIPASPSVKNLGVIIDEELILNNHINYICKSCYHYLRNIHTVRPYLTTSSAKTIVHSVISAKMDYCNSLINIPDFQHKVMCTKCCCQDCPEFAEVQIYNTLSYGTLLATPKDSTLSTTEHHCVQGIKGDAPDYIPSLLSINQLSLHSGDKMYKLKEHQWKLKSKGYRSCHIAALRYWNSPSGDVRNIELNLNDFTKRLSRNLFI